MASFALQLSPSATRDLDHLEDKAAHKILDSLSTLKDDPFPRRKLIKKIKGRNSTFYRLRVDKYRVFYSIEGKNVAILRIIARKDAEKFIKNV